MARTTPKVQNETLTWQHGAEAHRLKVETPGWYAWLEQASTFAFEGSTGTFTARKEYVRRGGAYWKAYRKRAGKLHRAYLGKSNEMTLERLQTVAAALARGGVLEDHAVEEGAYGRENQRALAGILSAALTRTTQTMQAEQTGKKPPALPIPLTSLVGREQDIAQACALLRQPEVRLLSIIGTGGVGKTRLALQVADQLRDDFSDGGFFVPLAAISDPQFVMPAIASILGLHASERSSLIERVRDYLQDKQLLLVLDNVEHLLAAAPQFEQLLTACPRLKLLVTSRTVLHLRGEHEFPTLPLALPDLTALPVEDTLVQYPAVALFVQRARAVLPAFQLTSENARAIAAICVRLDGLPLAIELAAARIKLFPPQALLNRLSHHLPALAGRTPALPERQQTLRATFQWSYDLLSAEEQRLFRLLCVFVGGCTLETVEALSRERGDDASDVVRVIASLMDHSLLQQRNQQGEAHRLYLLETIRAYGWECLEEQGELEESRRTHALWYLRLVEEIAPPRRGGGQQPAWLARLIAEQENLRAALDFLLERKEAELALRLSSGLWWFWVTRGSFSEGRRFLEASLALPYNGGRTATRARALCAAGELAFRQGSYTSARLFEEEGVAIYQEVNDQRGLAEALRNLGMVYMYQRDFAAAHLLIEQSIALCRELGDALLLGHAMDSRARLAWRQGDIETTRALCDEEMRISQQLGEVRAQISPRKLLSSIAMHQGDYKRAAALAQELLLIAETIGDQESHFYALFTLGDVAKSQRDDEQALCFYQQCLTIAQVTDDQRNRSMVVSRLGDLALRRGSSEEAAAHYSESVSLARLFEDSRVVGWSLLGLARLAKAEKQYRRAAVLLGAVEASLNTFLDLDLAEYTLYERDAAALRTYVGARGYIQSRDEGRTLTPEQALAIQEPATAIHPHRLTRYPDDLTVREMDVLRLVALGWTDAQIAEKLVISPRTVQGHLRSVYHKIGVTSRSAATRYALEHELT